MRYHGDKIDVPVEYEKDWVLRRINDMSTMQTEAETCEVAVNLTGQKSLDKKARLMAHENVKSLVEHL